MKPKSVPKVDLYIYLFSFEVAENLTHRNFVSHLLIDYKRCNGADRAILTVRFIFFFIDLLLDDHRLDG